MTNTPEGDSLAPIFISVKQAAQMLGLSTWSTYDLLDKGLIECRYQGRRRLVVVASVHDYARSLPSKAAVRDSA